MVLFGGATALIRSFEGLEITQMRRNTDSVSDNVGLVGQAQRIYRTKNSKRIAALNHA
jgi:hypothetical protein